MLEKIYSFDRIEKDIIGGHSLFIYGKTGSNQNVILIVTDALKDDIYIIPSPFPDYSIVSEQINAFNNNSLSVEKVLRSYDGDETVLTNDIVNYETDNYEKAVGLYYGLFGDTADYEGDSHSLIDGKVNELKELLSYGLIMRVGSYVDDEGQHSPTYIGIGHDGEFVVFACRDEGVMLRVIFTFS